MVGWPLSSYVTSLFTNIVSYCVAQAGLELTLLSPSPAWWATDVCLA